MGSFNKACVNKAFHLAQQALKSRIVAQSRKIPAVTRVRLIPQKHRY